MRELAVKFQVFQAKFSSFSIMMTLSYPVLVDCFEKPLSAARPSERGQTKLSIKALGKQYQLHKTIQFNGHV
jgi:hypothetical protein